MESRSSVRRPTNTKSIHYNIPHITTPNYILSCKYSFIIHARSYTNFYMQERFIAATIENFRPGLGGYFTRAGYLIVCTIVNKLLFLTNCSSFRYVRNVYDICITFWKRRGWKVFSAKFAMQWKTLVRLSIRPVNIT